jgi:glycerate 2-kinase
VENSPRCAARRDYNKEVKIQNFDELAVSEPRRNLLMVAEEGLAAIDTEKVMREMVRLAGEKLSLGNDTVNLADIDRLVFVAIGKCAAAATRVAEEILGDRITRGVIVDIQGCQPSKRIQAFCGTHPLPSETNLRAAEAIVATLKDLTERDLVIFVVSGGGSTLLFLPEDTASKEEVKIVEELMRRGARIREMNIVRKHLSLARGGYLAKYAYPARVVSLLFNDVPSDDISFIASGPTVRDITTAEDATKILLTYGVQRVCNIENCGLIETPKEEKYFEKVTNLLAVSNHVALDAMKAKAESLGFRAEVRGTELSGEADDVARNVAKALHGAPARSVLLWGGETTVTVDAAAEKGEGGRNLELSLSALRYIKDDEIILSLASDGRDHGPFAGALCDMITKKAVADHGFDVETVIRGRNTYPLFRKVGNYLMTGDTGSNVSDLIIALKH